MRAYAAGLLRTGLAMACVAYSVESGAAQLRLAWDPPTNNVECTPLTDLAGYKVFYGAARGEYPVALDVGNVTTCVISNLVEGHTYYFTGKAYNTALAESDYCDEFVCQVPDQTPPAPTTTTVATTTTTTTTIGPCDADYQTWNDGDPFPGADWKIDNDEVVMVIGYWMGTGEYHTDPGLPNGYPFTGADWHIDNDEVVMVIEYWMGTGEYHVEPLSPSGYAPGPPPP